MSGSSHSSPASAGGPAVSPLAAGGGDYNFDLSQLKPPPSFTEKLWSKTKQDPLVPIGDTTRTRPCMYAAHSRHTRHTQPQQDAQSGLRLLWSGPERGPPHWLTGRSRAAPHSSATHSLTASPTHCSCVVCPALLCVGCVRLYCHVRCADWRYHQHGPQPLARQSDVHAAASGRAGLHTGGRHVRYLQHTAGQVSDRASGSSGARGALTDSGHSSGPSDRAATEVSSSAKRSSERVEWSGWGAAQWCTQYFSSRSVWRAVFICATMFCALVYKCSVHPASRRRAALYVTWPS